MTASTPVVTNNTLLTTNIIVSGDAAQTVRTVTVQTGQQIVTANITVTPPGLTITPTSAVKNNQASTQVTLDLSRSEPIWVQGQTVALVSGTGVTAGPVTVLTPTTARVTLTIASNATPGARVFTTQTGANSATTTFTVVDSTPQITGVTPSTGAIGASLNVVITATNGNFSAAAPPVVSFGPGVTVNSVTVNSANQLTVAVTVEYAATAGARDLTIQAGAITLSSSAAFSVGTSVSGQPFQCRVASGVPPIVRAEGLTELVGDLVVVCTGGTAGEVRTTNLQLFLNTNITSRIVGSGDESEALLIIDENLSSGSGSGATTPGIYRGRKVTNTQNALVWPGIAIVAPGQGQRVLRFTNIRANAAGLGASSTLIPTQVVAFISASPSQTLALDNPQQVVAYVQTGVVADLRACNGTASAGDALALLNCIGQNDSGTRNLLTDSSGNMQFALRFREGFQSAFKPQIQTSPVSQIPSVAGTVYHSESGFVLNSTGQPYSVGGASTGTRLMARFTNIPANVRLFVTSVPSYGSSSTVQAALVQVAPGNVIQVPAPGVIGAVPGDKTLFCATVTDDGRAAVEVPVVNGTATAVWEILEANLSANETVTFGVAVAYSNELTATGRPAAGQTSVTLGFAPAYAPGTSNTASTILPVPRFVENTTPTDSFRIEACTTTLLFPYVASVAGFDTGIAISNTSRDPFSEPNRRLQAGSCMLHFYGTDTNGVRPPSQRTTRAVEPGETLTMVLSTGGGYGLVGVPNFMGYVMAQCDFQFAHGFAFLTDGPIGAARVAEGYLALVLDGGDGSLRGSASAEVRGK